MKKILLIASVLFWTFSCGPKSGELEEVPKTVELQLPEGFRAEVYADSLGYGRHMASRENGDLYLRLSEPKNAFSIVALRDADSNGSPDQIKYFEELNGGTGIKVHNGYLYFSTNTQVFRRRFKGAELVPSGDRELILTLAEQNQHAAKPIAFDAQDNMYITIGAPSNACQDPDRKPGVAGQDPCPLLETSGGIWRFSASRLNQTFEDGERFATGIRHSVGITYNHKQEKLYAMQHGRDQLHEFWPEYYSKKESAELPAEEFLRVEKNSDFGWPYCYYDHKRKVKLLNPEYGGNTDSTGRCSSKDYPLMGFPGHWAPNALEFYHGDQFPISFKGGAFIAFHGSWNRAPFPQQGYRVIFVPFSGNDPISGYQSFATGFAGSDAINFPGDAKYRPCGLAVSKDGSLMISDSRAGRIWRISYSKS